MSTNKGHSVAGSACRIAAWLYGVQVACWPSSSPSPPPPSTPTSRLGLVNQLEREIRFGCSGEIQLFTGTNPVTELVATRRRGATPCGAAGSGRRLDCDCDSLLVTICSMITLCSASDSHHPVSTISFGIKGTYTISPLKRDW